MPFVVRNHLHGGAGGLGLVLAAGGVAALLASLAMAQRGLAAPASRRRLRRLGDRRLCARRLCRGGRRLAGRARQRPLGRSRSSPARSCGRRSSSAACPDEYLGRVASVDSFVSSGLVPLSLATHRPGRRLALGSLTTLRWAGVIAGSILLLFLVVLPPLQRYNLVRIPDEPERPGHRPPARPGDGRGDRGRSAGGTPPESGASS